MIHLRRQLALYGKYKRSNQDEGSRSTPRQNRRQGSFHLFSLKADSTLFFKLPQRRVQQVWVVGITPASRKRPLSRPWVIFPLRASDEQNRFIREAGAHNRHCC